MKKAIILSSNSNDQTDDNNNIDHNYNDNNDNNEDNYDDNNNSDDNDEDNYDGNKSRLLPGQANTIHSNLIPFETKKRTVSLGFGTSSSK